MMRRRGALDALILIAVVAMGAWLGHRHLSPPGIDFTLNDIQAGPQRLSDERGPVLITLSAVGCPGCRQRVGETDRQAWEIARRAGVRVWNLLVYADPVGAEQWVTEFSPTADRVLIDEGGRVGVDQLGGSDEMCYILLDANHNKVWQGPADLDALRAALAR